MPFTSHWCLVAEQFAGCSCLQPTYHIQAALCHPLLAAEIKPGRLCLVNFACPDEDTLHSFLYLTSACACTEFLEDKMQVQAELFVGWSKSYCLSLSVRAKEVKQTLSMGWFLFHPRGCLLSPCIRANVRGLNISVCNIWNNTLENPL